MLASSMLLLKGVSKVLRSSWNFGPLWMCFQISIVPICQNDDIPSLCCTALLLFDSSCFLKVQGSWRGQLPQMTSKQLACVIKNVGQPLTGSAPSFNVHDMLKVPWKFSLIKGYYGGAQCLPGCTPWQQMPNSLGHHCALTVVPHYSL